MCLLNCPAPQCDNRVAEDELLL